MSPCFSSGRVLKNGEPAASGWTAEQTSCKNPGNVNSAERAPPPIVEFASQTRTDHPARASVIAPARPFGPEPTTTASYSIDMITDALLSHSERTEESLITFP